MNPIFLDPSSDDSQDGADLPRPTCRNATLRRGPPWVDPAPAIGALRTHPEEWEEKVVGFLDRELAEAESETSSA